MWIIVVQSSESQRKLIRRGNGRNFPKGRYKYSNIVTLLSECILPPRHYNQAFKGQRPRDNPQSTERKEVD